MSFYSYLAFFVWFFILVVLSFLNSWVWAKVLPGLKFRYFIAPGVMVHELSHAVMCLFMLAPVRKISFFSRQGGYVEHGRSRFGFLGNTLISIAPIFGISLGLWLIIYLFNFSLDINSIDFGLGFSDNLWVLFKSAWQLIKTNWSSWPFWIFIYLVISLTSSLAPSKKDFQNAFWGLVFISILAYLVFYLGLGSHYLVDLIGQYLGYVISLGVFWGLISLIIGLPVYLIKKVL
ncbi:MAG: hypothetical protein U5L76_01470 [Patescibacteria group bacterium]|nr:hypothetical protein [Patescibacteria group bacterium]